jgi:UDP-N-acetylglucosamine 2-epimerase (non-hydrolysing)
MHMLSVVGARPNFMKIAPFIRALTTRMPPAFRHTLVHTGQHYDRDMSDSFFESLGIPEPDVDLGIGSGTHAEQVGRTMIAFEKVLADTRPDWVVVVGDVNATCACAITARKQHVRLAHIEAGLRSFDETMPEEINRIVTDRLAHLLLTPDAIADANLAAEGTDPARIRRVGNIMIDTLDQNREAAAALAIDTVLTTYALEKRPAASAPIADGGYVLLTLHRPANVDHEEPLRALVGFLIGEAAAALPVVWTVHPRTRKQLDRFGLWERIAACPRIVLLSPIGYREMLRLNMGARIMLTDSGGLQEECCVLGTPCITLRENTERPVTLVEHGGTCVLAGNGIDAVRAAFQDMKHQPRRPFRPPLWDGRTSDRIADLFAAMKG